MAAFSPVAVLSSPAPHYGGLGKGGPSGLFSGAPPGESGFPSIGGGGLSGGFQPTSGFAPTGVFTGGEAGFTGGAGGFTGTKKHHGPNQTQSAGSSDDGSGDGGEASGASASASAAATSSASY